MLGCFGNITLWRMDESCSPGLWPESIVAGIVDFNLVLWGSIRTHLIPICGEIPTVASQSLNIRRLR